LKVRNPWGKHEWNGDWGDQSDLWTDELKQMLNYEEADDGIFWMNFEDFKDCFKRVQICKYVDDYSFDSIRFDAPASEKSCLMITMNVTERGHQTVSLSQKDHRFYPDDTNIKYSNCRVIVARKGDEGLEYVG
jgi:calpain-15